MANDSPNILRADLADPRPPNWTVSILASLAINTAVAILLLVLTLAGKNKGVSEIVTLSIVLACVALAASAVWFVYSYIKLVRERSILRSSLETCTLQYRANLDLLGISHIAPALGASQFSPDAVMSRAQRQVRFTGVFGHKWVMDASRQNNFRAMLTRVQLNGGTVQFLLLNPHSSGAKKLATFRKQPVDVYEGFQSIAVFKTLIAEFECFHMKLFDHFPFIRLSFVDGQCALSRFKVTADANDTLSAPQLVFSPDGPGEPWTMYQAFYLLYDYLWQQAHDSSGGKG